MLTCRLRQNVVSLSIYYNSHKVCLSFCLSVLANCRSQFLLDRLGRCLKLFVSTDSTSCHGLDKFLYAKKPKTIANTESPAHCLFEWSSYWPFNGVEKWALTSLWLCAPPQGTATTRMAMVVGWCVRKCVCVRDVYAIYHNNILPRLIMIIKIIFLYFIEIAHTDDFPSTGTRLVHNKSCSQVKWSPNRGKIYACLCLSSSSMSIYSWHLYIITSLLNQEARGIM